MISSRLKAFGRLTSAAPLPLRPARAKPFSPLRRAPSTANYAQRGPDAVEEQQVLLPLDPTEVGAGDSVLLIDRWCWCWFFLSAVCGWVCACTHALQKEGHSKLSQLNPTKPYSSWAWPAPTRTTCATSWTRTTACAASRPLKAFRPPCSRRASTCSSSRKTRRCIRAAARRSTRRAASWCRCSCCRARSCC
jgi:hypothetical protein